MRRSCSILLYCLLAVLLLAVSPARAAEGGKREVVLYSALTATTPQMPLWAAINEGWPGNGKVRTEYWKNLDDLRGIILAGKGDIWVGHLEGFAQAALRGAPVTLVAVTGWKKFYFIAPGDSAATGLEALAKEIPRAEQSLAVTPQDSPALAVLDDIAKRGGPAFTVAAMPPQQLMLEMLRGTRRYALLPEPLLTSLLVKKPQLRVAASLEDEFASLFGGPARLPLVGIAVNTRFAEREPERVRALLAAMEKHAKNLSGDPEAALGSLPETVRKTLGDGVIRASLSRDMVLVVPAGNVKEEIGAFLRMVLVGAGVGTGAGSRVDAASITTLLEGPFLFGGK